MSSLSIDEESHCDISDAKVQHSGMLFKKPFGHQSTKWQRRFFIVKEGFLLYYPEEYAKVFSTLQYFNNHPKGVIPLGGCKVEESVCGAQKYAIRISHENFKGELVIGAQSDVECSEWMKALQDAGRVTWKNAQVGDTIIHQMEQKTEQVAQEMKQTIDKLNEEAAALVIEKEKKAELEALAAKLEVEKRMIEEAAKDLRTEKETTQLELQSTLATMTKIQQEKDSLAVHIQSLETKAELMEQQRQKVLAELQEKEQQAKELDEEKAKLAKTTASLKEDIDSLEDKRKQLEREKEVASLRLREQMHAAKLLEEEKKQMADTAVSLQQNLEQVAQERSTNTARWREEYHRRVRAEQRFQQAEDSFKRLDKTLKSIGSMVNPQFEVHASNLKRFFDECIAEKQQESEDVQGESLQMIGESETNISGEDCDCLVRCAPMPCSEGLDQWPQEGMSCSSR